MKRDTAITISHISKTFKVPHEKHTSLKTAAVNIFKTRKYTKFKVLEDIDFEIKKGEFFGIVGKNGSGKSTLLKILANIYQPNKGRIRVNGTLAPFIELGVGFNPELTGRENVYLSGTILGMKRKKIEEIYNEIVDFAEIGEFMDQKLKNYSSGMQVRLAFSIAVRAESDILLIDEVLAVGDAAFQEKCLNYFEELKRFNKTVVFVSHDMEAVTRFCDKVVLIDNGQVISSGSADLVASKYYQINMNDSENKHNAETTSHLKKIVLKDNNGREAHIFESPKKIQVTVEWKKNPEIQNIGIAIFRNDGTYCFGTNTQIDNFKVNDSKVQLEYENLNLAQGTYLLKISFFNKNDKLPIEFIDNAVQFKIKDETKQQGIIRVKSSWY
ncbi:MAG: ABC transporter ATP-binding protein [Candidatus Saccharibacteria bacterium]